MKVINSVLGGNMRTEYIPVLARYFRKMIQAYAEQGIAIGAMSTQNEPDVADGKYPQCLMTSAQQLQLVTELRKEFVKNAITTKLWGFDSNWEDSQMWSELLSDTQSRPYLDAIAFHPYVGEATQQTVAHTKCPWLNIHMTEQGSKGIPNMQERFAVFQNWGNSYTRWIPVVDDIGSHINGPFHWGGGMECPVVVSATNPNDVTYRSHIYLSGQISRFVKQGAYFLESAGGSVQTIAFQNPDGAIAAAALGANPLCTLGQDALTCITGPQQERNGDHRPEQ